MKKIVALVLSLVMVLGLATTAFGAITLWSPNGSTAECDLYDGTYNTKLNPQTFPISVTYDPGQALKLDKAGNVVQAGMIPHYTMSFVNAISVYVGPNYTQTYPVDPESPVGVAMEQLDAMATLLGIEYTTFANVGNEDGSVRTISLVGATASPYTFVQVDSVPADADASEYFFVKNHNAAIEQGYQWVRSQTKNDPYVILKMVDAVTYYGEAVQFTEWSDDCEAYAEPLNADVVDYYTVTKGISPAVIAAAAKIPAFDTAVEWTPYNVLVGNEVVTLYDADYADQWVFATQHTWVASAWDAKTKAPTEYTCANCKTVGTVINASINAPAGAKIDKLLDGTLVAYNYPPVAETPNTNTSDTVESAKTFDAGIAMYVGMSVMAAAGSAVVLKKKD